MTLQAQYTSTTTAFRLTATPATGVALPLTDPSAVGQRPVGAYLQATTQDIRFTVDGTTPTASVGALLTAGAAPWLYFGALDQMQFIRATAGSVLNVIYVTDPASQIQAQQILSQLTAAQVDNALGYTPANVAGDTFTGLVTGNVGIVGRGASSDYGALLATGVGGLSSININEDSGKWMNFYTADGFGFVIESYLGVDPFTALPFQISGQTHKFYTGENIGDTLALTLSENGNASLPGAMILQKHTAPADGDLAAGDCALWFDQTNGAAKLMIKAKSANGTVATGSVALT